MADSFIEEKYSFNSLDALTANNSKVQPCLLNKGLNRSHNGASISTFIVTSVPTTESCAIFSVLDAQRRMQRSNTSNRYKNESVAQIFCINVSEILKLR